ncbi:TIGR03792 family protein [Leptolyngbya sp. FACHB-711]|uniref:TIGR03792 family protein n=1 Tax=unclassified Leptolyngbya TaxID=2650499 RepID=UPI00168A3D3F|nr:TIGR03792 family protein [Cyanobacteria bacterium FACHB-502]MBD2026117.1 TIGR03792 family protein [Leptolyngbya sp. FACHB-711]
MVIEWLKFRVMPELREKFVQKDDEIWTAILSQYPGFLRKEVWISPDQLDEVIAVIHWESMEAWKSVPADVLEQTDTRFAEAMGAGNQEIVGAARYQVRKRYP